MARKKLPFDSRLVTAGRLVVRARISYDIWWYYRGVDTRPHIIDTMRQYSEFFKFDTEAHFASLIVQLAALLEFKDDTINLESLSKEAAQTGVISRGALSTANRALEKARKLKRGLLVLRHNLYAHRSAQLGYQDAFKRAGLKPNDIHDLTMTMLKFVNLLLIDRGLKDFIFDRLPLMHTQKLLRALGSCRPDDAVAADESWVE